ncbi:HpaII family restriction endonuclease [Lachnospiraceae bacterium OttesenSCG-928-J05]|nr:HpaII family restriction endonuclease [Lachnospiraceae bacterium OttesenSCG-928-J05]
MTGKNKGEWSELYVLLRLLEYGKIYAADSELKPLDGVYFPIIKIIREYKPEKTKVEYCNLNDEEVEILLDDVSLKKIGKDTLKEEADYLYEQICSSKSRSFKIIHTEQFMEEIECYKVTASSEKKTDIKMQIHDINTGYNPICGFSIKSELGNYSSLLNASGATNFIFEVTGVSDEQMDEINRINTVSKIQDRMKSIFSIGALTFCRTKNKAFENNLMLIDSKMPELIGELLLYSYRENVIDCKELIESLTALNPLSYPADHFYSYKFKKFLCSVALDVF